MQILCQDCQKPEEHMAWGLCKRCYHRQYQRKRRQDPEHQEKDRHLSREYQRRLQRENPEHMRARSRLYRQRHPDFARAAWERWEAQNPEKAKESNRQYAARVRARDPEKALARVRDSAKKHPERRVTAENKRRALKRNAAINDFTVAQWITLKELYQHRCAYCGKYSERLTQDHVIPLSKGGSHTVANIVPACRSCNSHKRDAIWTPPNWPMEED